MPKSLFTPSSIRNILDLSRGYYLSQDPQKFYDKHLYDFEEGIVPLIPPGYFLEINPQEDPSALRRIRPLNLPSLTIKIKRNTTSDIHKSDHVAPVHNAFLDLKYNKQPINAGYTLEEERDLGYTF